MQSLFQKKMPGIQLNLHAKSTKDSIPHLMSIPELVKIPMSMHIGKPCEPTVKIGDSVRVGQLIGDSSAFVSAPIHSSVSGTVTSFDSITYANGICTTAIVIKSDGLQTLDENIKPPLVDHYDDFIKAIRNSGLVGLGGAGFPTHVKFSPDNLEEIDTLLINGAECEPYITSDYRIMLDHARDVINGVEIICNHMKIKRCIIAIEDDKMDAIHGLMKLTSQKDYIEILPMKVLYPRGAEKVIIHECLGRIVPQGKLPSAVGVLVSNIRSACCISRYFDTGIPLIQKTITLDGSAIDNPQNIIVPIGTRIEDVINYCGGYKEDPRLIIMGGPMMGLSVYTDDYPIIKNNNAILAFAESDADLPIPTPCIRCGRCINACPMNLMPLSIERALERKDPKDLIDLKVDLCMECGCCSYVCPAKRQLVLSNQMGKTLLKSK